MKTRITRKDLQRVKPIAFGYCEIQELLHYEYPIYYTCGIYGRNADVYKIGESYIITGYRTGYNINEIPYKITQLYEKKAREYNNKHTYEQNKKHNRKLLKKMIEENTNRKFYID